MPARLVRHVGAYLFSKPGWARKSCRHFQPKHQSYAGGSNSGNVKHAGTPKRHNTRRSQQQMCRHCSQPKHQSYAGTGSRAALKSPADNFHTDGVPTVGKQRTAARTKKYQTSNSRLRRAGESLPPEAPFCSSRRSPFGSLTARRSTR